MSFQILHAFFQFFPLTRIKIHFIHLIMVLEITCSIQITHSAEQLIIKSKQAKNVQEKKLLQRILILLCHRNIFKTIPHKIGP